MIKVIHSHPVWLPQTQTWMHNQAKNLPMDRIECHVVCERVENIDQFALSHIHSLEHALRLRYYWDKVLRKLKFRHYLGYSLSMAKKLEADIIHSHFGHIGWLDLPVARQAKLKHIVTFYGFDANGLPKSQPIWRKRYKELFKTIDGVLCEGPFLGSTIEKLGCPSEKIKVHHLGVELDRIPYQPREWNPNDPLKILMVGRFAEKKGFPYALEALGRFYQKNKTEIEITIIGDADLNNTEHAEEKRKIMSLLDQYKIQKNTRMLGFQPYRKIFEEAYQHHLFLSPSVTARNGDSEGGAPVTIIEMAASGMLVISTNHCDIPEVVIHNQTGFLAPEKEVDALVEHLEWLVMNPTGWRKMLDTGRNHIDKNYCAKMQGVKLANSYSELVKPCKKIAS